MDLVVKDWWTTLRLPLAAFVTVLWFVLLQRRKAEVNQNLPSEAIKVEVASPEKPAAAPKKVDWKPSAKSKVKKAPKKFTRTIPEETPSITADTSSTPPEIHIFY